MNHIYRSVWNEITRTWVAAAEIVRSRGKRSSSRVTAEGSEAAVQAGSLLAARNQPAQAPPTLRRRLTATVPRPMALEQRFMFDGAGAVEVADVFGDTAAVDRPGRESAAGQPRAPDTRFLDRAQVPPGIQQSSPGPVFVVAVPTGFSSEAELRAAVEFTTQLLAQWTQEPGGAQALLQEVFSRADQTLSQPLVDSLLADLQKGRFHIVAELRSQEELQGHPAAYTRDNGQGEERIYVNLDWLQSGPPAQDISRVLLEELGHAIDQRLNPGADTPGDEGAVFSARLTAQDMSAVQWAALSTREDQGLIQVEGRAVAVEFSGTLPVITSPGTLSGAEDSAGIQLFGAGAVSSPDSTTMEAIVELTAGNGTLSTGAVSGSSLAQQGNRASINTFLDNLVFVPTAGWSGTATVSVRVESDYTLVGGVDDNTDVKSFTFDINVASVNDAPAGTNSTITINEDTPRTLTAADFGFSDVNDSPANSLSAVKITTLPGAGSLTLSGSAVSAGAEITAAQINAGNLVFTPAAQASGNAHASFTFQVKDDGGTTNGGVDLDPTPNTLTFNVTPVNDAPVTADASASVAKNGTLTFSLTSTDADGGTHSTTDAAVTSYRIVSLPGSGTLSRSDNVAISAANTVITAAQATGMKYTPASNMVGDATFQFQAIDAASAESTASTFTLTTTPFNFAPTATVPTSQTLQEDTSLGITGISLADSDASANRVQLTLSVNQGTVALASVANLFDSATGGNAISATSAATLTVYGTVSALNDALATVTYTPTTNYFGADTLTVTVNDLGNADGDANAGNNVPKIDTKTVALTVTNVADAPVTGSAALAAVNEDTLSPPGSTVSALLTAFSDADANTLAGIAISADASTSDQGSWQYSVNGGASWSAVGSVSSSSALLIPASAWLRFLPAANSFGTPGSLTVHAIDSSTSRSFTSDPTSRLMANVSAGDTDLHAAGGTLSTSVTSVNDPMVVAFDKPLPAAEGGSAILSSTILQITDAEALAGDIVYTLVAENSILGDGVIQKSNGTTWSALTWGGTFTQADIDAGWVRYQHAGAEPLGTEVLAYTVTDASSGTIGTTLSRTLKINVAPVNDAPLLYVPGQTVPDETNALVASAPVGGEFTFTTNALRVKDLDNTDEQLVLRIESSPSKGFLSLNGVVIGVGSTFNYTRLGQLTYTHTSGAAGSDTFNVTLRDGAGGVVSTTAITLALSGNRAPIGIGDIYAEMFEDPTSYGSLTNNDGAKLDAYWNYLFTDADTAQTVGGYAIVGNTANASTQGRWQYSTDNGTTWADIGTVNDTSAALVIEAAAKVRFAPVQNYNGTPPALQVRVLDSTYAGSTSVSTGGETRVTLNVSTRGGTSAISDTTNTVTVLVRAVNDDPVLVTNSTLTLANGGSHIGTIGASLLQTTDVDTSDVESNAVTFRLQSLPSNGVLRLDGAVLGVGATFTQADVGAGRLSYEFNQGSATTDAFTFTVRDGGHHALYNRPGGIYETDNTTLRVHTFNISIGTGLGGSYGGGTPVSDPSPTVAVNQTLTLNEAGVGVIDGTKLSISDLNNDPAEPATPAAAISITLTSVPTGGTLYFQPDAVGSAAIPLRARDTFTQADVNTGRIRFNHDGSEDFVTSFNFTARDGAGNSVTGTFNIDVTPVNDPPGFELTSLRLAEGAVVDLKTAISPDATTGIYDSDGQGVYVDKAGRTPAVPFADTNTLTFRVATLPTNGSVRIVNVGKTYDAADATTYTEATTATSIAQSAIEDGRLRYQHNGSETTSDTLTLEINDGQGQANSAAQRSVTLKVMPVNRDPVVQLNTGATVAESGTVVVGNTQLKGTDTDNTATQLQFRLTGNVQYGRLELVNGSTVTQLGVGSRVTQSDVDNNRLRYVHDGTETTSDAFNFTLSDGGGGNEPTGTFTLTISPVNDPPVITVPAAQTATEDRDLAITGILVSDLDALTADTLTITLSVTQGTVSLASTTGLTPASGANNSGSVGYTGTAAQINAALATLSYRGAGNFAGADTLTITVNDGGNRGVDPSTVGLADTGTSTTEQATATVAINVLSVNDAPTITLPAPQSVNEDTTLVLSVAASNALALADVDAGSGNVQLTLSVSQGTLSLSSLTGLTLTSGTNGTASLTVTGTLAALTTALNGGLSYTPLANFHGADTLTVTVNDLGNTGDLGGAQQTTATLELTVTPVNDTPTVTDRSLSATEDTLLTFSLTSSDVDSGSNATTDAQVNRYRVVTLPSGGTLTTSGNAVISAGDLITVAQATNMKFTPTANFNGATTFTYTALDTADAESVSKTVTVNVAAVNDAPAVTGGGDSVTYTEGVGAGAQGTPVKLDANGDFDLTDVELTQRNEDNFNSATLTVARSGSAVSTDRYWFDTTGMVSVSGTANSSTISVSGTSVGTITNNSATGTLLITFNANADKAGVEAVMKAVTFASTDDDLAGAATVSMVFNDGNAGSPAAQGSGGAQSAAVTFTVTVTNTNDAPTLTGDGAISVAEDTTNPTGSAISALFSGKFSDLDGSLPGSSFAGLVITGDASNPSTQGRWQYSTDSGSNWYDVSPSGTAPTSSTALVLSAATQLRFVPVADFNSRLNRADANPGALTVLPVDNSSGSRLYTSGNTRQTADTTGLTASADIGSVSRSVIATVTQVNDAPQILYLASTAATTLQFTEAVGVNVAGTAVLLDTLTDDGGDAGATPAEVFDTDLVLRNETTFNGARLEVGQKSTLDTTDLFVVQTGSGVSIQGGFTQPGSGITLFNSGSAILYNPGSGDVVVATLTDNSAASGKLVITFNANATSAAVNTVLRNIAYSNDDPKLQTRDKTVQVAFFDGNGSTGNAQGTGGVLSATADIVVSLVAVNDSPTLSGGATIATVEDTTSTATTFATLLASKLADPDAVSGTTLAGVAISAFDTKSLGTWEVNLGNSGSPSWVSLGTLASNVAGGVLSTTTALLLSASTEVRFVPSADANTGNAGTTSLRPTLTVFGVEDRVPTGAANVGPSAYTTAAATPQTWDTTSSVGESRVTATAVTVDLTIAARNDAPTVATSGSSTGFTNGVFTGTLVESPTDGVGTPAQQLLDGVTVADLDLSSTNGLDPLVFGAGTITVTLSSRQAGDQFTLAGSLGSAAGVASTSGGTDASVNYVVTLTSGATVAQVQTILQAIRYEYTGDEPPTAIRNYTVVLSDGNNLDAGSDTAGGPDALAAGTITGSVTITAPNDPPTLTATAANPTFTENGPTAVTLFSGAATGTIESAQAIIKLVITVSGLVDGAQEKLTLDGTVIDLVAGGTTTATNAGSVTVTLSGGTATLTFTDDGLTTAQTSALVNGLAYRHTGEKPTAGNRTVTVTTLQDSGGTANSGVDTRSITVASTVTVVPVNDAPVVTAGGTLAYTENGDAAVIDANVNVVSDADDTQMASATVTIASVV
ncbi:MAG: cadherin-like domain-containing protein, partial [Betaproteobacteria bacterium]